MEKLITKEYKQLALTSGHKKKPNTAKVGASAPVSAVFSGDKLSLAFRLLFIPQFVTAKVKKTNDNDNDKR